MLIWMSPPAVSCVASPIVRFMVVVCFAEVLELCTSTAPPVLLDAEAVATPSPAEVPESGDPLMPRNCWGPLPPPPRFTTSFWSPAPTPVRPVDSTLKVLVDVLLLPAMSMAAPPRVSESWKVSSAVDVVPLPSTFTTK